MSKLPPTVSIYARTPNDQRVIRRLISAHEGSTLRALYIGPSFGEDFFSWLPIGYGTGTQVSWDALEIDVKASAHLRKHLPDGIMLYHGGDFRTDSFLYNYDIIIANHVWTIDAKENLPNLQKLLDNAQLAVIARDHKQPDEQFAHCSFRVFKHKVPIPNELWHASPHGSHIFIRNEIELPWEPDDPYIKLVKVN